MDKAGMHLRVAYTYTSLLWLLALAGSSLALTVTVSRSSESEICESGRLVVLAECDERCYLACFWWGCEVEVVKYCGPRAEKHICCCGSALWAGSSKDQETLGRSKSAEHVTFYGLLSMSMPVGGRWATTSPGSDEQGQF